jgi:hypothetical protein
MPDEPPVNLAAERFKRNAKPGVDACIALIEDAVLAGVTNPIDAACAIFASTARYLLQQGCPPGLLWECLAKEIDRGAPPGPIGPVITINNAGAGQPQGS